MTLTTQAPAATPPVIPWPYQLAQPKVSGTRKLAEMLERYPDADKLAAGFPAPEFAFAPDSRQIDRYLSILARQQKTTVNALRIQMGAYGPTAGPARTREFFAGQMNEALGLNLDPARLVPFHGNTQAYHATLNYFLSIIPPGRAALLMDERTYTGAISPAEGKAQIFTVKLDDEGPIPASLEETILEAQKAGYTIAFYYTIPDGHNPTGLTFSETRRSEIMEVLKKHQVFCFEDNAYTYLTYPGTPRHTPLAALDTDGLVIYSTTFSKVFRPGARVAMAHFPSKLKDAASTIVDMKAALEAQAGRETLFSGLEHWIGLEAAMHDIKGGEAMLKGMWDFTAHRAGFYADNWNIVQQGLHYFLDGTDLAHWRDQIECGFFSEIEYNTGFTATDMSTRLLQEHNVAIMSQEDFIPEHSKRRDPERASHFGRICFSYSKHMDPKKFKAALMHSVVSLGNGIRVIGGKQALPDNPYGIKTKYSPSVIAMRSKLTTVVRPHPLSPIPGGFAPASQWAMRPAAKI